MSPTPCPPFPTGTFIERLRRKVASRPVSAPMTAEGLSVRIAEYRCPTSSHVTHFPVLSVLAVGDYEEDNWRSSLPPPPSIEVKPPSHPWRSPSLVVVVVRELPPLRTLWLGSTLLAVTSKRCTEPLWVSPG